MTFSYINSLFLKSIGLICPVEIERHIIGDITSQKLFKKVNELLNLSPTMKEIEEWSLEAKSMKKTELTKLLQKTMRDKYKIKVFDFIMTISTWEFIYEVIRMEWFGSFSKSFKKKISHFNGKTNEER